MVILSSSYIESPRNVHEYTGDVTSYVRKYWRLDPLYKSHIMIRNQKTIKIRTSSHGLTQYNIPSFLKKTKEEKQIRFIEVITKYQINGIFTFYMYIIKEQKQELHHSYNLIKLPDSIHPMNIDKIFQAEFPIHKKNRNYITK